MRPLYLSLLTIFPLALAGCTEDPSFLFRWRITEDVTALDDADKAEKLTSAYQCSRVGLSQLRLSTFEGITNVLADQRILPCFPQVFSNPDRFAGGPELEPGDYAVVLEALRDTGGPWTRVLCPGTPIPAGWDCEPQDETVCLPKAQCGDGEGSSEGSCDSGRKPVSGTSFCRFGYASTELTVEEGQRTTLDEFVLLAPPQCDDGVDNDQDGLTDLADPACLQDPFNAFEIDDTSATLISITTTYLGANSSVTCAGMGIGAVQLLLSGGQFDQPTEIERQSCSAPQTKLPPYSSPLEPGTYTLEVLGIAAGTEDVPATVAKTIVFEVLPDVGAFVKETVDLAPEDFLEEISGPLAFAVSYQATDDHVRPSCQPDNFGGVLCVEEFDITLLEDGQPTDAYTLKDFTGDCADKALRTEESAVWAGPDAGQNHTYSVEIQARGRPEMDGLTCPTEEAEGDAVAVCFGTTEAVPLAPGSDAVLIVLPRVLDDDGLPPAGCQDCTSDAECQGCVDCCIDSICEGP